jgi:hypothetical protein
MRVQLLSKEQKGNVIKCGAIGNILREHIGNLRKTCCGLMTHWKFDVNKHIENGWEIGRNTNIQKICTHKTLNYYYFSLYLKVLPSSKLGSTLQTRGVSHYGLAILHSKVSQGKRKNYGNSNISPCKNIIFTKSSKRNQIPSRYIITLL